MNKEINMPSGMRRLVMLQGLWASVLCITGCTWPQRDVGSDPQFGQSVKAALLAQELSITTLPRPDHATFMELQQSWESHQKAKPMTSTTGNRSSLNNTARPFGQ
jgi:hypothetical protein